MSAGWLIAPIVVLAVLALILQASQGEAREGKRNASMKDSYLYTPAAEFEPGNMIIEETVPTPVGEFESTDNFVKDWNERKQRQQEHSARLRATRAEKREREKRVHEAQVERLVGSARWSLRKYYYPELIEQDTEARTE